ncbi:MAG: hypothetical protein ACOYND_03355 [Bacteroidota bacterium]
MKVVFMFLFVILFTLHIQAQNASLFNKFIPKGYQLLDSKSGDINQDGITDYIIICKSPNEDQKEMKRPLLILHGNANGELSLFKRNDNIVLCYLCGGVMGDPYTGMTLKKNYFSVEHEGGSSDKWSRIITFKYNATSLIYVLNIITCVSFTLSNTNKSIANN